MIVLNFSTKDVNILLKGFSVSPLFYNFLLEQIPILSLDKAIVSSYARQKFELVLNGERISMVKIFKLWKTMEKLSNRSDMGLMIADNFTLDKAGIIGELFLGTKNLKQSVYIIQRFIPLIISNISISYEETDDEAIFYFDLIPRIIIPFSAIECFIKICYNWVNQYHKVNKLQIEEIHYCKPKPKHFDYYTNNFPDTDIFFNQAENFVIVKKDIFYIENKTHKNTHYNYLLKYAQKLKHHLPISSFKNRVKNQLLINMPDGKCHIGSVAKNFNISISTLKRKLKEENTTFSKILEQLRKELSIIMLKDKALSYEEIAYLLGYSEYSPFFRAFKHWFKKSPSNFRV